jgi:N-acetylmuramoyl-L-alanine amidase
MRAINKIVVHCSGGSQNATIDAIKAFWRRQGWKRVGYHYIIEPNGRVTQLASVAEVTNGVRGHNQDSVHVCYIGGVDRFGKPLDNRTEFQKRALVATLQKLKKDFPNARILGHRDLSPDINRNGVIESREWVKSCPCFNALEEYRGIK